MSFLTWCSWRCGGLAIIIITGLSYYVLSREYSVSRQAYQRGQQDSFTTPSPIAKGGGVWVIVFAYYCLLSHLLVFFFPLRANWALWNVTQGLRVNARARPSRDFDLDQPRPRSSASLSSTDTLIPFPASSHSSETRDHCSTYDQDDAEYDDVAHVIIIPNYKEEIDTLRETLQVLAYHPQAKYSYDVFLAMEQRESDGEAKAMQLVTEFTKSFRVIDFTIHPSNIPSESAGKGSNVAWAAKVLSRRYPVEVRKNVLVTGIDADSHLSSNYFALATRKHLAHPETALTTMYSAPIIFDRNADCVPAVVRVADILWAAAGLSGLYRGSSIAPPTSVYTLPLELVDRVGGWDCGPEAIGEDLHMFLKCFFALNGHLTTETILSPVSQTNVTAGGYGKGLSGIIRDMRARYNQAQRHMWGALDSGFALLKFAELWQDRKCLVRVFKPLHTAPNDANGSFIPDGTYIKSSEHDSRLQNGIFSDITHVTLKPPDYGRIFYLFHRLFEAHILPVQTTVLIVASTLYMWITKNEADVYGINWTFKVCSYMQPAGVVAVAILLLQYERFHRICLETRQKDMLDAGLAEGMNFSHRQVGRNIIDYFMVPLVAPLYSSIPCAQAQICHFWTLDLVYAVSKKATRLSAKSSVLPV